MMVVLAAMATRTTIISSVYESRRRYVVRRLTSIDSGASMVSAAGAALASSTAGGVALAPSTAGETAPVTSVAAGAAPPIPAERRLDTTIAAITTATAPSDTPTRRPTLL